jgi:large repetitive protein
MREFFGRIFLKKHQQMAPKPRGSVRLRLEHLEERDCPAPLAPTGLVASGASASSISLNWNASSDTALTGYDVYERTWVSNGGGKGSHGGHYVYTLVGSDLTSNSDTVTGLATGSSHTYLVTALDPSGASIYSLPASAESWIAPTLTDGSSTFELSDGTLSSSAVNVTVGLTTQITILASGNPLTYSVQTGPSTIAINSVGVVTYTPAASEVGTVNVTFEVANSLGSVTQTVQFNVAAAPNLATPTITLTGGTFTYDGTYHTASATAVGTDGVTAVSGSFAFAYNGSNGLPTNPGTYTVLATFTSADPNYGNATALGTITINKETPKFSGLTSQTIAVGTKTITVSGSLGATNGSPGGDTIFIILAGTENAVTVNPNGTFSTTFSTSALSVAKYKIQYSFAGDANFDAVNGSSVLDVVAAIAPTVTTNPANASVKVGQKVTFKAAATGSPSPTVQWQVSTDGGKTYKDIVGATSLTLTFTVGEADNNHLYRAVFTNSVGTATTTAARLKALNG